MEEDGLHFQAVKVRNERGARAKVPFVVQPKSFSRDTGMLAIGIDMHRGRTFRAVLELDSSHCPRAWLQKDAALELREFSMYVNKFDDHTKRTDSVLAPSKILCVQCEEAKAAVQQLQCRLTSIEENHQWNDWECGE